MSIEDVNAQIRAAQDQESEAGRSATLGGEALTEASAGFLAVRSALESLFEQYQGHLERMEDGGARMIGAHRQGESAHGMFARATEGSGRAVVLMADASHVASTAETVAGQVAADKTEYADPGFGALIEAVGEVAARAAERAGQAESVARLSAATNADADAFIAGS